MHEDSEVVKYRQADQDKERFEYQAWINGGIPMNLGHARYLMNKESRRKCARDLRQLAQMYADDSEDPAAGPGQGWQLTDQVVNAMNLPPLGLNNSPQFASLGRPCPQSDRIIVVPVVIPMNPLTASLDGLNLSSALPSAHPKSPSHKSQPEAPVVGRDSTEARSPLLPLRKWARFYGSTQNDALSVQVVLDQKSPFNWISAKLLSQLELSHTEDEEVRYSNFKSDKKATITWRGSTLQTRENDFYVISNYSGDDVIIGLPLLEAHPEHEFLDSEPGRRHVPALRLKNPVSEGRVRKLSACSPAGIKSPVAKPRAAFNPSRGFKFPERVSKLC